MFSTFFSLEAQRKRLLKKVPDGPLKHFLSVPFPSPQADLKNIDLLALDFETTGLSAEKDQILSLGYVEMHNKRIKLATAKHQIIMCEQQLSPNNVIIHQIMDQEARTGIPLNVAVEQLLKALAGKVMLVHYAKIEQSFLAQACLQLYGFSPVYPIIDTLVVAKRRLDKHLTAYDPSELRLANLRNGYHFPGHYAHNALNDAIATGELFLAELSHHHKENSALKKFLR